MVDNGVEHPKQSGAGRQGVMFWRANETMDESIRNGRS